MKLAAVWLLCIVCAVAYLGERWHQGIALRSDLLALLPDADRDPAVTAAKSRLTELLGERVVVLIGDRDRAIARNAGATFAQLLRASGVAAEVDYQLPADTLRQQGAIFFSHRSGLLSPADRVLLTGGRGDEIAARALATVFGPVPVADAALLRQDPFLLLPAYISSLPSPVPRVELDGGIPTVRDGGKTYVLLTIRAAGDSNTSVVQDRFVRAFDAAEKELRVQTPDLEVLRLGSLFYFAAEGRMAESQTMAISVLSLVGTIGLILVVFRSLRPLLLLAAAIVSGIFCAFAVSLWWFGTLNVLTLTFGASLIGIAIDYCLQYLVTQLSVDGAAPAARLRRVLPAIFFGFLTTMIGYATLMATPFPGLREIAVFSAVGLAASFVTIILWFPPFDRNRSRPQAARLLHVASKIWWLWETPRLRGARFALLAVGLIVVLLGAVQLRFDDDIRRLQALPEDLQGQEASIHRLTGLPRGGQFLVVRAASDEAALEAEEALMPVLDGATHDGWLSGYQAVASVVPSAKRQAQNRQLVHDLLMVPILASYAAEVGLPGLSPPLAGDDLTLADIPDGSPLSYIRQLALPAAPTGAIHLMLVNGGVGDFPRLRQAVAGFSGVTAVDPVGDITQVLTEYRQRALILLLISAAAMIPVLLWRYGLIGTGRVLLAPATAVVFTPALLSALGMPFTFFTAMGLILVLSIGFDYAIFCRETPAAQKDVTMLGTLLAMVTTLLSFGLLAFSGIFALRTFGLVLFIGTVVAFALSPLARDPRPR